MQGDIGTAGEVGVSETAWVFFCCVTAPFGEGSAKEWTEIDRSAKAFEA